MKKKTISLLFVSILSLLLPSCSLKNQEDFEAQSKAHLDRLNLELRSIHDLEELKVHQKHLKKRFDQLTKLMIDYHDYLEAHPEQRKVPEDDLVISAAELRSELARLLEIEGAKELIIEAQKEAALQLSLSDQPDLDVL